MFELTREELPIDFDPDWIKVLKLIKERFGKKPELETILFLIGINELGQLKEKFTKEEKQDLMHIAVCRLLTMHGYFKFAGVDDDGWPLFDAVKEMPVMSGEEQERLLKKSIIRYFEIN